MPKASSCLLTELQEEPGQNARIIGLLLESIGVAKAFTGKVDGIDLVASESQIPVVAIDAPEDLVFEEGEGSAIELHGREDAMGIEPCLIAGVDAVEVNQAHPSIHVHDVCMVN